MHMCLMMRGLMSAKNSTLPYIEQMSKVIFTSVDCHSKHLILV